MKHPIEINVKEQFPDARETKRIPGNCSYRIPYATGTHTKNETFSIVEQDYDGKDGYLNLIEVKNKERLDLIIRTTCADLFWLYQLQGTIRIEGTSTEADVRPFYLKRNEYALLYSPPKTHRIIFEPGHHLLFFFVVDAEWLQRYPTSDKTIYSDLILFLQLQKDQMMRTEPLKMHNAIHKETLQLFTIPNFEEMEMDAEVYSPIAKLITISREDLLKKNKPQTQKTKDLLENIRKYCESQLAKGVLPSNQVITNHFNKSSSYIFRIHKREYGETLKNFQDRTRMLLCQQQVRETDKSFVEIAYNYGFSAASHFTMQYRKFFDISPNEDRLRYKSNQG